MSRTKLHTPGKQARGGLEEALKALGRTFAEAGLWRQAALAWKAHAQHFTRETLAAALAAHHRAAEASGAPRGAELPELEGMSDATKAAAADKFGLSADPSDGDLYGFNVGRPHPSKTRGGTNASARQGANAGAPELLPRCSYPACDCLEGFTQCPNSVTAAAELAAGGAPAPAGEGAQPPLGKIANTCSRAKETRRPDGRRCLSRLGELDPLGFACLTGWRFRWVVEVEPFDVAAGPLCPVCASSPTAELWAALSPEAAAGLEGVRLWDRERPTAPSGRRGRP